MKDLSTAPGIDDGRSFDALIALTAERYAEAGRFAQGFVRGKLAHDPVYRALLGLRLPLAGSTVLDLGCGRGIALSLLMTAEAAREPLAPPRATPTRVVGIERRPKDAEAARRALGTKADIVTGDILIEEFPRCRIALLLDVLLYLSEAQQDALLERVAHALEPDGFLIVREADRDGGWRFWLTLLAERGCALARGAWSARYHYRSRSQWKRRLTRLGFAVKTQPMSDGTPFCNVLFLAKRSTPR